MKKKTLEYLDFNKINTLLNSFNTLTGFVTAILDLDGNILSQSGWRTICTNFHRINPKTARNCSISDTELANSMLKGSPYTFYTCLNGLVDVVFPLIIQGEHVANLFSGQFFFEKPDIEYFREQAEKYGFEEDAYLKALSEVPVVSESLVVKAMDFLQKMTTLIAELTLQKMEQAKLSEERNSIDLRYKAYVNNAPLGVFITNEFGDYLEVNEDACRISGYAKDELESMNLKALIDPVSEAAAVLHFNRVVESGRSTGEIAIRTKNHDKRWWRVVAARLPSNRFLGFALDITEQKEVETALHDSERRLNEAQQMAHVGSWEYDIASNTIIGSDEGFRIYGLEVPESGRMDIAKIEACIPEKLRIHKALIDLIEYDSPYDLEFQINPANGDPVKTIISKAVLEKDSTGVPLRVKGVIQDITERKQAEEKQKTLLEQLGQAQKMESIGRLAGGVAHDFNNMLGVILGYTELTLDAIEESSPLAPNLLEIKKAAEHSVELTRQLLAFARKQAVSPQSVDINSRVGSMYNILKRLIGEEIELVWNPGKDTLSVMIDPAQVDQILANLCINARDAIQGQGIITISTEKVYLDAQYCDRNIECEIGSYILLSVSDTGCGMDADTKEHLFEPFFTTKEMQKGTGLGFSTVYGIVKQNNGYISVYSEPDLGTVIKMYLPEQVTAYHAPEVLDREHEIIHSKKTILVVEDEASILDLTKVLLESFGYTVYIQGTPDSAVTFVEKEKPAIDLLITDVVMPGMHGKALFEKLNNLIPGLKCLYMSGYTADVIAHKGVLDKGVQFLQKPFTVQMLSEKVSDALK